MSIAPTPLSRCPLLRLEIHGGAACSRFDATNLESSLTATLEAQRSTLGNENNLLLLSHFGPEKILSIQLTELRRLSYNKTEIVGVEKLSQKICFQVLQKDQTIIFHFKENRDFNVVLYTLGRFGFRIKDGIPLSTHSCTINRSGSPYQPTRPAINDFGPRLSSITPLQSTGGSLSQSPFSFTSMLDSEVPLSQIQSSDIQYQPICQSSSQDLPQQSTLQDIPAESYVSYLNPYQMYLGHQESMYQPLVSSPLRNVVEVNGLNLPPRSPESNSQYSSFTNTVTMGSLNATRSISAPSPLSNSWQQSTYMDPTTQGSSDYQESPPRSQDTGASLAGGSQATDDTEEFSPLQNTQDFRKLMPRTRSLPFVKDKKAKAAQVAKIAISMSAQRQADKKTSQSRKTPRDSLRARHWKKDSPAEDSDTLAEERDPTKSPEMDSSSPNFQIDSCSSSQPTISLADSPLTVDSSFKAAELPTILAIDDALLEEVNQSTSKLLKQYNADIGRGCDGAACAQFYLEQIHIARREFWFNYLKQGD